MTFVTSGMSLAGSRQKLNHDGARWETKEVGPLGGD